MAPLAAGRRTSSGQVQRSPDNKGQGTSGNAEGFGTAAKPTGTDRSRKVKYFTKLVNKLNHNNGVGEEENGKLGKISSANPLSECEMVCKG